MLRSLGISTERIPWRLMVIGVIVGLATPWIYFMVFGLSLEDVAKIGIVPIAVASLLIIVRLILQGLRFYFFLKGSRVNFNPRISECVVVRVGSEFVASTSPSYIGGELVRAGYLMSRGLDSGKALWVSFSETFYDVFVGTSITIAAAIYVLVNKDSMLASILLLITLPILLFYLSIFFSALSRRDGPHRLGWLLSKTSRSSLLGRMVNWLAETYRSFSTSLKLYHSRPNKRVIMINIIITVILAIIYGLTVFVIYSASGIGLEFYEALLAAYSGVALGVMPITLGGSGTTELGVSLFVRSLRGELAGSAVIAWRLSTHVTTLIVSFICLVASLQIFIKRGPEFKS
jgi:uncharacterized protein (TIRG00374 family)